MVFLSDEQISNKIETEKFTLFYKIMYGGLGYGSFCMPTTIFKILFTIIFPPLGILINNLNPDNKTPLLKSFPYLTTDHFINIFKKIDKFIIAFILTMLFYIPGLVYVMTEFKTASEVYDTFDDPEETKSEFKNTDDNTDDNTNDKDEDDNTTDNDEEDDEEEFKNIDLNKLRKELLEHK